MGFEKNIVLFTDDKQVKRWKGEFKDDQNTFYRKIFEINMLRCIKEQYQEQVILMILD